MSEPTLCSIYRLRVVLNGVSPLVWRRLLVSSETNLADLHEILQLAFGWSGFCLSAIRSFFRLVALRDSASVGVATRVLAIPLKRIDQHLVGYLTRSEVDAILAANQLTEWSGRRDHALLLSLYNTGARVSEIISLQRAHFSFGVKSFVQFKGKGRKERAVPLWLSTAKALQAWFRELDDRSSAVAFPNARGSSLTRDGVNYILQQAVERAAATCLNLKNKGSLLLL